MVNTQRLPRPVADGWDWQLHGSCRGMNSEVFFHSHGERGPERARRDAIAKTVCERCPVIEQCRQHALSAREAYGVWGGLTERERLSILHRDRLPGPVPSPSHPGPELM